MASSDRSPGPMPPGDGSVPPGKAMTMGQQIVDKGAQLMQSLKPVKQMSQHVCTFAMYSHDMTRQIETHHFLTRLNQDFLQCAVFNTLPAEEQKLWHSHAYEIKSGLWVNPRVPEMVQNSELKDVVKTYGKFWCTWQVDRGDKLPLGAPALMMSPQDVNTGIVKPELVKKRDEKYKISSDNMMNSRANIETPKEMNPYANYWIKTGKGFAVDIEKTPMELRAPFP
ncbi:hypothetical protein CsSME_00031648 [Camellia sinensis var. sinensis]